MVQREENEWRGKIKEWIAGGMVILSSCRGSYKTQCVFLFFVRSV